MKFAAGSTVFRMRVDELTYPQRVTWTCLGEVDEWTNTRLAWELTDVGGETDVQFTHAGWKSAAGTLPLYNTTWGALLYRLRAHCTGKHFGPLFD
jgi:hypothetical protein